MKREGKESKLYLKGICDQAYLSEQDAKSNLNYSEDEDEQLN